MSAGATAFFTTVAIERHRTFGSMAMDFAFFDQIVWNTSEGRWFETSFVPYNFLGQHVEPILLLFAALYRIAPAPEWMLAVQAVSVGVAAILLFLLARTRLRHPWLAVLVAGTFLFAPTLHEGLAFDYHSEMLAPAFIFGGLLLLHHGRTITGVTALLGTLLLKEDAALVLIGLALPLWLMREHRAAAALALSGLFWIVLVVGLYMPWVRGESSDLEARYAHLGSGAGGIATGIASNPIAAIEHALGPAPRSAIGRLVATHAGLPLAAPFSLLAAAPVAGLQFLSSHQPQQELRLQYGAQVLPLVSVATVEGLRRLERSRRSPRIVPSTMTLLAVGTTVGFLMSSPFSPLSGRDLSPAITPEHDEAIREGMERIPDGASVSAQSGLAAHLSQREAIWEFPVLMNAEFVILDLDGVVARPYWSSYPDEVAGLPEQGYALVWERASVRVYQRSNDVSFRWKGGRSHELFSRACADERVQPHLRPLLP